MKKAIYLILAGVAIGILVAPDKGSETWRKVKARFDDWKDDVMDQADELVSQGKDTLNTVKNEARKSAGEW